jgi:hypothetical protein
MPPARTRVESDDARQPLRSSDTTRIRELRQLPAARASSARRFRVSVLANIDLR